jgi:hypothetical protein
MDESGVKKWGANNPVVVSAGRVKSAPFDFQALHKAFRDAITELFASGAAGSATKYEQEVWVVERPKDVMPSPDWPDPGKSVIVSVSKPSDAKGWVAELTSLKTAKHPHFYQVGEWIITVRPDNKFYAYVFGKIHHGDDVMTFKHYGETYDVLAANVKKDNAATLSHALVSLLRSKGDARGINAYGANWMVAVGVSETVRQFPTWGINILLLDMMHRTGAAQVQSLNWHKLIEEGMHPMARGGSVKEIGGYVDSLEAGVLMKWLAAHEGAKNTWPTQTFIEGPITPEDLPFVRHDRRTTEIVENALKATLTKRFSDIETLFPFEITGG